MNKMVHRLYLHTGTNLGEREANLRRANELIEKEIGPIAKASSIYRTQAWGITQQPDFLNQALCVMTTLEPEEVLDRILQIEKKMGRKRVVKWGERLIDIDILFYDQLKLETENLVIPHPHMHYRNFVLIPLAEIAPDLIHPHFNKTISALVTASEDELAVDPISD